MRLFALLLICSSVAGAVRAGEASAPTLSPPIVLEGIHDRVITGLRITNAEGHGIDLRNCSNIRIERCVIGPCSGQAVNISGCSDVTVTSSTFQHVATGVYALSSSGIKVIGNRALNVQGPMPRGQMVQFDKVTGAGNRILANAVLNQPGRSNPEDAISLYKSSGTPDDPIMVSGNRIRGGGPSVSGGGIMTGDNGGAWIVVRENTLVDPGQYGIAFAGGSHIRIIDNRIYGASQPFTNVGLYVWNQSDAPGGEHEVRGNQVRWLNKEGKESPAWNSGNMGPVAGWDENEWHADVDAGMLPADLVDPLP